MRRPPPLLPKSPCGRCQACLEMEGMLCRRAGGESKDGRRSPQLGGPRASAATERWPWLADLFGTMTVSTWLRRLCT
jgi:Zn-dependent alcohol dehydrogenase